MPGLRDTINQSLKESLRGKDEPATRTLRLILAAIKDRDITARGKGQTEGIGEEELLLMLQTMIKQRRESITMYEQGGRLELAAREQEEIDVIERFLPKQLGESEIKTAIGAIIGESGASGLKDMGNVMAELRARYAGQMDFGKAAGLVKASLSGG